MTRALSSAMAAPSRHPVTRASRVSVRLVHFVIGSGGQLRKGGIDRRTGLTAVGFDTDLAFLAAEIDGDELYFNAISRVGAVIDSGIIQRRKQE